MSRFRTLPRIMVGVVCAIAIGTVASIARDVPSSGGQMTDAADAFLASLSPELRARAAFDFDDPHRTGWFFTPRQDKDRKNTRKGVPFEELNEEQKQKALALLKTGTSAKGYEQATTIMSLEGILRDAEKKGAMVRNPDWYFVSIFGKPSKTGKWGWRIEGHHLAMSFTVSAGEVESPTPYFFGANPATVKNGPRSGLRPIPEVEDLAQALVKSLSDEQKKVAHKGDKPFPEIAENTPAAQLGAPVGIAAAKLTDGQRETLDKLLMAYLNRMPTDVASVEAKAVKDAGPDKIHFAYTGEAAPGKGYTYQIQGPTFVAQFLNVQADGFGNPNNHIHSVWRRLPADFGLRK